ncbi:MAG: glycosyltransferase family 2 protein [Bacteroidota bacterium]|nr:glycosyltransferase [Odoribacter sp.]MDP3643805.1 glycosyltransferase family 2 protein [Bacteroidota bacterium]
MFSLIIPVYNEEGLIGELAARSIKAVESFTTHYEILFINDGSTDSTLQKLIEVRKHHSGIKIVDLSKNFGHQAAFTAGLEMAMGNYVAMMDGDLQDPPEMLSEMYRMIKDEGYDIVSGKRKGRKGKRLRLATNLFHIFFKKIAGIDDMENSGNFSIMNRAAVNALVQMKESIRYLPGMRSYIGFRQGYIEYIRDDRMGGEPKMTLSKLVVLGADAIFSFSKFPIKVCLFLGTIGTIVFFFAGIYALADKIFGLSLLGWSSTVLSIYFLGSIQLIFLGVVGEYVYRIYKESQNRPIYLVKKFYDAELEK